MNPNFNILEVRREVQQSTAICKTQWRFSHCFGFDFSKWCWRSFQNWWNHECRQVASDFIHHAKTKSISSALVSSFSMTMIPKHTVNVVRSSKKDHTMKHFVPTLILPIYCISKLVSMCPIIHCTYFQFSWQNIEKWSLAQDSCTVLYTSLMLTKKNHTSCKVCPKCSTFTNNTCTRAPYWESVQDVTQRCP